MLTTQLAARLHPRGKTARRHGNHLRRFHAEVTNAVGLVIFVGGTQRRIDCLDKMRNLVR